MTWLILGLAGWFSLMTYRIVTDGLPKKEPLKSYVRGFIFALLLGPLCFVFLGMLLFDDYVWGKE